MADVVEIDASTGTAIERDFTPAELAQRDLDSAAAQGAADARAAELAEKDAIRASALAKLAALGLSEAEAIAIFTGGG